MANPTVYGSAALQLIVHKKLQSKIKVILEDYGLNLTQWLIISRLYDKQSGQRTTDLAHFMHVEVPLVTMMSRPLRKRGLITSDINKPDKREKLLKATTQAREMIEAVEKRLEKQLAGMAKDISRPDMQTYFRVLQTMMVNPA